MPNPELASNKKKESISTFGVVVHDVKRFATIAGILRKFGFGNLVQAVRSGLNSDVSSSEILKSFKAQPSGMASKLRATIEELGTTYIKFGQMLSTRYDLLPRDIIDELTHLQDDSPQMPFETVEAILNEAYGNYHDVFASFAPTPLGSASIAQAHAATLVDGTRVVVKVQRPNLLPLIRSDIDILQLFAGTLDDTIEEIAYFNLPALITEFENSIVTELNFLHECENIRYFEKKYADKKMFEFPTPFPELSRRNILVMREVPGQKITLQPPDTPQAHEMANAILEMAFEMVFHEGVFHADPHPGNVFATPDGRIGLLDFGLIGHFTPRQRSEFTRVILALHVGDCAAIARTLLSLGHPTKRVVLADLEAEIGRILQKYYLTSLQSIDIAAFASDFIAAGQKFAVQIPSEFMNAVRALINIEGIIQYLHPNLNLVATLASFARKLMTEALSKENLPNLALHAGLNLVEIGQSLPSHVTQFVQDITQDGVAVRLPESATWPIADAINHLATRLCITVVLVGLLIAANLQVPNNETAIHLLEFVLLFWIVVLVVWHYRAQHIRKKFRINPMLAKMRRRSRWY